MPLSISPNICYTPAVFYDRNHNPLNIPCEGPKTVSINFSLSGAPYDDGIALINFAQLFTSGQMSALQSVSLAYDFSPSVDALTTNNSVSGTLQCAGSGQTILCGPALVDFQMGSSFAKYVGSEAFPLAAPNPPLIKIDFSQYVAVYSSSSDVRVSATFYNYVIQPFNTTRQGAYSGG